MSQDAVAAGIDIKIRWIATLDMRTRPAHSRLDGEEINPAAEDEYFTIGDDKAKHPGDFRKVQNNVNCRCTTLDIIDDKGPELRTGRNPVPDENGKYKNEFFTYRDFDTWAEERGLFYNKSGQLVKK
jgi:uncharacterized protein with gpF-like domain